MKNNKTKQIYIHQFEYPFEAIEQVLLRGEKMGKIFENEDFKIKKFIGSDWVIKESGFIIFFTKNETSVAFALKSIEKNDFIRASRYRITHLNGEEFNDEVEIESSVIKNTIDNTTIIEVRLNFNSDLGLSNLEKIIKFSFIKKIIGRIYFKINLIFQKITNVNENSIIINHSFIIKKNYKEAFNFFYNWNNMAKSLKTDKIWKIKSKNEEKADNKYKDFYIIINQNIQLHYHVISIDEVKDEKIEIVYHKTTDSIPALNNYIKFSFFNISKNLCFFLYETHLPLNISSSIFQTVSYYVFYCNKKSKNYIENNL